MGVGVGGEGGLRDIPTKCPRHTSTGPCPCDLLRTPGL